MEYLAVSPESIARAAEVLRSGGIVAFPTETVYGLGADAYNSTAVVKVFEAKGRPRFDPLIVHIAAIKTLEEICDLSVLSGQARKKLFQLCENFWPGPLSIILPKSRKIPGIVTAGLPTAAVRFPAHETAQTLISLCGGAVAAPSANPFSALSPTRAEHVRETLGEKADIILDGGAARIGVESTVLDITSEKMRILRHGGTPKETIEELIGSAEEYTGAACQEERGLASPGQLKTHYSPRTPLFTFNAQEIARLPCEKKAAFLFFDNSSRDKWLNEQGANAHNAEARVLSASGSVSQAASCLFEILHELDSLHVSRIFAQFAPQEGLGAAINDRLRRASAANLAVNL